MKNIIILSSALIINISFSCGSEIKEPTKWEKKKAKEKLLANLHIWDEQMEIPENFTNKWIPIFNEDGIVISRRDFSSE